MKIKQFTDQQQHYCVNFKTREAEPYIEKRHIFLFVEENEDRNSDPDNGIKMPEDLETDINYVFLKNHIEARDTISFDNKQQAINLMEEMVKWLKSL